MVITRNHIIPCVIQDVIRCVIQDIVQEMTVGISPTTATLLAYTWYAIILCIFRPSFANDDPLVWATRYPLTAAKLSLKVREGRGN